LRSSDIDRSAKHRDALRLFCFEHVDHEEEPIARTIDDLQATLAEIVSIRSRLQTFQFCRNKVRDPAFMLGGRRPPFTAAPVADSQRSSFDPLF
jgi:hypothetical protein